MSARRTLLFALLIGAGEPAFAQEAVVPTPPPTNEVGFTPAQVAWIEARLARERAAAEAELAERGVTKPGYKIGFDVFIKGLYQNDQSQGSTWLGNPHPEGDNYSGQNGLAGVLGIRIDGKVTENLGAGARLETRFGQQFADFYESGDIARDPSGRPAQIDASGESLGMNHAAYAQLRGLYIHWEKQPAGCCPLSFARIGSSDLGMFNEWTVGRVRFIDRDNAKGVFLGRSGDGPFEWAAARVALPKLYASAGFNTGIADPLIENPFWARDAAYVAKVGWKGKELSTTGIVSYLLDEEADLNDPDALGSTNLLDAEDGVVSTVPRYTNWNATLDTLFEPSARWRGELLVGLSRSAPDLTLVFNGIDGNQGLSPIPLATVNGYAVRARGQGQLGALLVRAEYFNIGADWVATFGARREADVLLTEGFLDGQLPTLNIANEFMDITEPFYESIIGWHGATVKPRLATDRLELEVEATYIDYNTDGQGRCTSKQVAGCEAGVYPDFLFPDGMTDTDFFTFANTNDRGRDPRAVYRANQARHTLLGAANLTVKTGDRLSVNGRARFIRDIDLRDDTIEGDDDYAGSLVTAGGSVTYRLPRASATGGVEVDFWDELHRSGAVVAGVPLYPDYRTLKSKVWVEARYEMAGANLSYRLELLNKDMDVTDDSLDRTYRNVVRSLFMIYAGF